MGFAMKIVASIRLIEKIWSVNQNYFWFIRIWSSDQKVDVFGNERMYVGTEG
jgi:hypothetical protein